MHYNKLLSSITPNVINKNFEITKIFTFSFICQTTTGSRNFLGSTVYDARATDRRDEAEVVFIEAKKSARS